MAQKKVLFQGRPTGFKCGVDPLFVGDVLSVRSGYGGFMRVVEHSDGFWLEDWQKDELPGVNEAEKLDGDIDSPYRKVDPRDPYSEPPFPIMCDQCKETVIGYFDVYDGSVTWTKDCGEHYEEVITSKNQFTGETDKFPSYLGKCNACMHDPHRVSKANLVQEYFKKRYQEAGLRVKAFDFPPLKTEEDVDCFIEDLKAIQEFMDLKCKGKSEFNGKETQLWDI